MPFTRPTLASLIAQAKSDLAAHLTGADTLLRRSVEAVLARVVAGVAHGLHGHMVWLSKQLIPDRAEGAWLVRWASIRGITPVAAVKAQLVIGITGSNGSVCPATTRWTTADGTLYTQNADATIAVGVATAIVTALVAGDAGNQDAGVILSLVSPVSGITATSTVTSTSVTGFDQETPAALLVRYLHDLRTPPSGGGPGDYVRWAKLVAGVTRAWEIAHADGPNRPALYFVCDASSPIIPDAGVVATVQASLNAHAPVASSPTAYAPTGTAINFTIHLNIDSAAARAAVTAELAGLVTMFGSFGGTMYRNDIVNTISAVVGSENFSLTLPAADTAFPVPQIPTMGTITWS
jgi:uncharacterized phage protein gp47/JayE